MAQADQYIDAAGFLIRFPEFAKALPELISEVLSAACPYVDPLMFGSFTREAHALLAAHKLTMLPAGRALQLQDKSGESNYLIQFDQICARISPGAAVL